MASLISRQARSYVHQAQLAAGIPNAQLRIVERAGHNPHSEQPELVIRAVGDFLSAGAAAVDGLRSVIGEHAIGRG